MSTEPSVARDGWATLRRSGQKVSELEIATRSTDIETGFGPARLALGQNGEARLLLPLSPGEHAGELQEGQSLQLRLTQISKGGEVLDFLDLVCRDPALEHVFNEVVDEILDRIRRGSGCVAACTSTLKDFRDLLDNAPEPTVDVKRIRGLVGELVYLDRLLNLDGRAWELWRGPLKGGERHDFRGRNTSVEIKTTARVSATRVRISSIDQLAIPTDGSLHLMKFVLEQAAGAPLTVFTLASRILARCTDPDQLKSRLAGMGCDDHASSAWNAAAFQLEADEAYEVRDGFPRIVAESFLASVVPTGVSNVEYDIDLGSAKAFLLEPPAADRLARSLISCL